MRFVTPDFFDPKNDTKADRRAIAQKEAAVRDAFRVHNDRIRPLLSPALQELQNISLHDGLWQSLRIDGRKKTLTLRFLCGDLIQGYFDVRLRYTGISLSQNETSLLCLLAYEKTAESDHHEIDLSDGDPPPFIHRISWHTGLITSRGQGFSYSLGPEIELHFERLTLEKSPLPNRKRAKVKERVRIARYNDKP